MRDEPRFVEQLHRDLRDVRWPEPAEIRARARRRSRRTSVLAAVAVLVVASGSAYAVNGRPVPPAPPAAVTAGSPVAVTPAEIPQEALLRPVDVPLKTGALLGESGLAEPVRIDPVLEACGRERGVPSAAPTSRYSRSQTLLRLKEDATARGPALTQDVYRLDPGQGRLVFGMVGLLLNPCAEWQLAGSAFLGGRQVATVATHRWETPVSGFAGDQSVLLSHASLAPRDPRSGKVLAAATSVEVTLLVRVGDLVTVIALKGDVLRDTVDGARPQGLGYADLTTLGETAARRLCPWANPGC